MSYQMNSKGMKSRFDSCGGERGTRTPVKFQDWIVFHSFLVFVKLLPFGLFVFSEGMVPY
ncbi:MAG: hypothetical protein PSX81_05625 [bacterium]|nr:hypothetical protein [bacterium]